MGCYNMSCAITNMPILCGDDMVVALASEGDQMSSLVHPVFFYGEYNDYGTVENYDDNSFEVSWFKSYLKATNDFEEAVRSLVECESPNKEHHRLVTHPGRFTTNHRVIFVLRKVWDQIIEYRKNRCSQWNYFNGDKWAPDIDKEGREGVDRIFKIRELEKNIDQLNKEEELDLRMLQFADLSSDRKVFDNETATKYVSVCEKLDVDPNKYLDRIIEMHQQAYWISGFVMETNSHIITRYAGQETCDEEYNVLVSMMQQRMYDLKQRWEE